LHRASERRTSQGTGYVTGVLENALRRILDFAWALAPRSAVQTMNNSARSSISYVLNPNIALNYCVSGRKT